MRKSSSRVTLLAAKQHGLIQTVKPILEALVGNAYHLSNAMIRALVSRTGGAVARGLIMDCRVYRRVVG